MSEQIRIPFSPPDITEAEIAEVADALRSGWITTGPKTKQLERELAAFLGTPRVACLGSSTPRRRRSSAPCARSASARATR